MGHRSAPETLTVVAGFARRLRETRAVSGLTQMRLARLASLHHTEVSKLERALTDPRLSTVVRLAHGLGVPTSALVEDRYEDRQLTLEEGGASLLAPGERRLTPEEFEEHFGRLPTGG
ncbi:MAG TPA: helix-turn-helix transcriptional regulator [Solirubrobacteraceae bacterium]|nr:helix-turn-helix transcriptional regulator [Solirubrobacteraceae bacterium]